MSLVLPNLQQRVAVIGKTGSGKTVFGCWLLSQAAFHKQPYVVFDYKGDDLLAQIEYAHVIKVGTIPTRPGIYICRPTMDQEAAVEAYLRKIWSHERIGLFFDEQTLLPKPYQPGAVRSIFVTGRSKFLPVIACTQRPAGVSPYLFSEADFFACFYLQKPEDTATFASYTPWSAKECVTRLPKHYCRWYDSPRDFAAILKPCPDESEILQTFHDRLKPQRRVF